MKLWIDGVEHEIDDRDIEVSAISDRLLVKGPDGTRSAVAIRDGDAVLVSYLGRQYRIERKAKRASSSGATASGEIRAPMPGLIVDVLAKEGDDVVKGTRIVVLEAMKTQQPFVAPFDGKVEKIAVVAGQQVDDSAILAVIQPLES